MPSIDDLVNNDLPSVEDFITEENAEELPSVEDFIEIEESTQTIEDADGNTFAEACDNWYYNESSAYLESGTLSFSLNINDITDECYVTGDYLNVTFSIISPYEGPNEATVYASGSGSFSDYFSSNYFGSTNYYTGFSETPVDSSSFIGNLNTLTIEISSLGTGLSYDPNTGSLIIGERLVGSYTGTIYKVPNDFEYIGAGWLPYTQPVSLEINFSLIRTDN